MKRLTPFLLAWILTALLPGCDNYDDDRIPERAVHIEIYSAQWSIYGVYAYTDWREFIKNSLPKGFSWSANSYTGFGGVLLVCGLNNQLLAYDLACPVECSSSTRIEVDEENCVALCSVCGSTYDIFNGYGQPVSGPAREKKYGLTSYTVNYTSTGYLISR